MTKMPQLDPYLKTEVSTEVSAAKAADKELSRIQTFMLDGMAPLTAVQEALSKEPLSDQETLLAVTSVGVGTLCSKMSLLCYAIMLTIMLQLCSMNIDKCHVM